MKLHQSVTLNTKQYPRLVSTNIPAGFYTSSNGSPWEDPDTYLRTHSTSVVEYLILKPTDQKPVIIQRPYSLTC